jgi:hypothetical protein
MLTAILTTCSSMVAVDGDTVKCDGVNLRGATVRLLSPATTRLKFATPSATLSADWA